MLRIGNRSQDVRIWRVITIGHRGQKMLTIVTGVTMLRIGHRVHKILGIGHRGHILRIGQRGHKMFRIGGRGHRDTKNLRKLLILINITTSSNPLAELMGWRSSLITKVIAFLLILKIVGNYMYTDIIMFLSERFHWIVTSLGSKHWFCDKWHFNDYVNAGSICRW